MSTVGYVVGGVGVAALGVGSYFGIRAMSAWSDRNEHCDATGCDGPGLVAGDDADRFAKLSNLGFGVGVVAIGVGAVLVLSDGATESKAASSESSRAGHARIEPALVPHGGGVTLRGIW